MLPLVTMATLLFFVIAKPVSEVIVIGKVEGSDPIPDFFADDENIYTLITGLSIIVLCLIIAIIIFRVRSRSMAFDNSLFQNL